MVRRGSLHAVLNQQFLERGGFISAVWEWRQLLHHSRAAGNMALRIVSFHLLPITPALHAPASSYLTHPGVHRKMIIAYQESRNIFGPKIKIYVLQTQYNMQDSCGDMRGRHKFIK